MQRGKNQINAARKAGAKILIWAGLPSTSAQTDGKYPCFPYVGLRAHPPTSYLQNPYARAHSFDFKAEVTAYARTVTTSSFRVIDVQPPGYISNVWKISAPKKSPEGTWLLAVPSSPTHPGPIIDLDEDYGEYVIGAIERGGEALETVYASPQYITREEQAAILTKGAILPHRKHSALTFDHYSYRKAIQSN